MAKFAIGVGSALMDIILQETDEFLEQNKIVKGGMSLVEADFADKLLAKTQNSVIIAPGGSACNTTIGLGRLSKTAKFIGCCGNDELGEKFKTALAKNNVKAQLTTADKADTGRVVSVVTPDAQRSMLTYLGASGYTDPAVFTPEIFAGAALVHIEGYLIFNEKLLRTVMANAKKADVKISLDLASFNIIEQNLDFVQSLVREYVDIVLANEDEAKAYTKKSDEKEALDIIAKDAQIAVVKLGKRGSLVKYENSVYEIAPVGEEKAKDTTGAGDLWASGFLYGIINNLPIEKAGFIGSLCGYEVCRILGAHIPDKRWESILEKI
ncbi:MAG: adenosine kinase [Chitinispirillales bacterium]|jgi:sugar/nucleoside kinase (ribokinase family)|nr:adenosine kinase [Chitinispirillales bacterium]